MKRIGMIVILLGMHIMISPLSVLSEDKNEDKKAHYVGEVQVTAPGKEDNLKIDVPVAESTYQVGATAVDVLDTQSGIDINRQSLGTPNSSMVKSFPRILYDNLIYLLCDIYALYRKVNVTVPKCICMD